MDCFKGNLFHVLDFRVCVYTADSTKSILVGQFSCWLAFLILPFPAAPSHFYKRRAYSISNHLPQDRLTYSTIRECSNPCKTHIHAHTVLKILLKSIWDLTRHWGINGTRIWKNKWITENLRSNENQTFMRVIEQKLELGDCQGRETLEIPIGFGLVPAGVVA